MFDNLPYTLLKFFVLTVCLTIHEAAHALAALWLGDDTAKRQGRLSLNPLVHMDPLGSLMMLSSAPIGWAKPVPVNPFNIRKPETGLPLVAFAGPLSNLVLAVLFCWLYSFIGQGLYGSGWHTMLEAFITINFSLAVFNLLPLLPLDGSKIVTVFMSDDLARRFEETWERIGVFPLVIVIGLEFINPGHGPLSLWFRLWRPVIQPILWVFDVPRVFF